MNYSTLYSVCERVKEKVCAGLSKRQEDIKIERDKIDAKIMKLMDNPKRNKDEILKLVNKSIILTKEYEQPFKNLFY